LSPERRKKKTLPAGRPRRPEPPPTEAAPEGSGLPTEALRQAEPAGQRGADVPPRLDSEGTLTLIVGGVRSGKSAHGEHLARTRGRDSVLFVATAEAKDADMAERIRRNRLGRPTTWRTLESPRDVASALEQTTPERKIVLLDCLTLLVSNILLAAQGAGQSYQMAQNRIDLEIDAILRWRQRTNRSMILVTNEVGMGLLPPDEMDRAYRDLLGRTNARVASVADEVILMVAGLPLLVRSLER
jgi:adenosylcobinamide kinase / adenosylcobinamide-phosphate guanylyltransferase